MAIIPNYQWELSRIVRRGYHDKVTIWLGVRNESY